MFCKLGPLFIAPSLTTCSEYGSRVVLIPHGEESERSPRSPLLRASTDWSVSSSRLVEGVSLYHSKNSIVFRFLSPLVLEAAKKPKWRLTRITRRDAMTGRRLKSDIPTSASLSPRSVLYVASDASLCRFPRRGRPKSASPRFRSSLVNKNENFLSFSSTPRCTHKRKLSHTL